MNTPIPKRMRRLPRDARGYPVPFVVFRDADGKAHFTINDIERVSLCLAQLLCAICGERLIAGQYWFVGGPLSALHERGAYNDTPMHRECAHYALKVCPYLALRSYSGRVEGRTLTKPTPILEQTMMPERPDVFVCLKAGKFTVGADRTVRPARPYKRIEYWRDGAQIPAALGEAIAQRVLAQEIDWESMLPRRVVVMGRRRK